MYDKIIKEIEALKSFTEDIGIPQKKAELIKINEEIKFAEGKINAYNDILTLIQSIEYKASIDALYGDKHDE